MRNIKPLLTGWMFVKSDKKTAVPVTLPHTWNAEDGQDGGNDYFRGTCEYTRQLLPEELSGEENYIEFNGAAMSARVFLDGEEIACHRGGYSAFRALIPHAGMLRVEVDNSDNAEVYPQKADFTFYGGLYREVRLISVPREHFELLKDGTPGIKVTPVVDLETGRAEVTVETWQNGDSPVTIQVGEDVQIVRPEGGCAKAIFHRDNPRLWDGTADPYLYKASAFLESGDEISTAFGCRRIAFDAEKGFLLNNRVVRLVGTARHQDRQGMGNAITRAEHEEDISLLLEMGANSVRLAHYQHDQYFYDLCDRAGLIVWAEIPYITEHMPEGRENTVSQMTELIVQNYNHPSIVCWGLSNEITATTGVTEDLLDNHRELNDLCHRLDPTRPTTMAHAFMLSSDDPFVTLSDICSYNLYYGWYVGDLEQNDEWFDSFHANHPEAVIGLSEYGADANPRYQSPRPEKGDWTEGYQALYHEHMLKMWSERPYIWAMHCWNGFDFGADGRDEGGKPGQNQKGLITFDRKIKKDAFYLYKAYLSQEPFVHVCGSRYADRTEEKTEIKVYSNQAHVVLYVDGKRFAETTGDKIFRFEVPISGEHEIMAVSGSLRDSITVRKVKEANHEYIKDAGSVTNWFDRDDEIIREGYFSIKDSMAAVRSNPEANRVFTALAEPVMEKAKAAYGDVAKKVQLPPEVRAMMERMSVEATLKQISRLVTPELIHKLNHALNQVKKDD